MAIWFMHITCWITKATNTHSVYVKLVFHYNSCYRDELQCYVILKITLSFLLQHIRFGVPAISMVVVVVVVVTAVVLVVVVIVAVVVVVVVVAAAAVIEVVVILVVIVLLVVIVV